MDVMSLVVGEQLLVDPGERGLQRTPCTALMRVQREATDLAVEPRPGRHVLAGHLDGEVLPFEDEAVAPAARGQHPRAEPLRTVGTARAATCAAAFSSSRSSLTAALMRA